MSRLCLTLTAPDIEGMVRQAESCLPWIDLAELRVDLLAPTERSNASLLTQRLNIPLILTIRREEDGGQWGRKGETMEERKLLFERLLSSGNWYCVELEHDCLFSLPAVQASGCRSLRARSDSRGSLLDEPLQGLVNFFEETTADGAIPKLTAQCGSSRQLLALSRLSQALRKIPEKVLYGLGDYGTPSIILAERFGSSWTYVHADTGSPASSNASTGQSGKVGTLDHLHPQVLNERYRFREIREGSPIYAVIGRPISHSRSPIIHNDLLQQHGLPGSYIPVLVDDLDDFLRTCDILGISGLSVTVPYKEKALAISNRADSLAIRIGSANTLIRDDGGWHAYNTDALGFMASLLKAMNLDDAQDLKGLKALIIGSGGAARAAVHVLSEAGVHLVILNRTIAKAAELAAKTGAKYGVLHPDSSGLIGDVDIAVQTTTVGMAPDVDADPIPWWNPSGCALVYDMIYNPEETTLLKRAASLGVPTVNGSDMLRTQAVLQFELFTGENG